MEVRSRTVQFHVDDRVYNINVPMEALDRAMDIYCEMVWRKEAERSTAMSLEEVNSFVNKELVKSICKKGSELNRLYVIFKNEKGVIAKISEQMAKFIVNLRNSLEESIDKGEYRGRYIYSSSDEKYSESKGLTFEEYRYINNPKTRALKQLWLEEIEKTIMDAGPVIRRLKIAKTPAPLGKKTSKLRKFFRKSAKMVLGEKGVIKTFKEVCKLLFKLKWLKIKARILKGR